MPLSRTFDSSTIFLLRKKLTDVHLSKSQMHFYQPHGNLQTVKRTTLGAGKICVKCVI